MHDFENQMIIKLGLSKFYEQNEIDCPTFLIC